MNRQVMRISGKARQRSLVGKEKENSAGRMALVKDPSVSGVVDRRKRHPLRDSKSVNVVGAAAVEKISKPLAKMHSTELKDLGPTLKVGKHPDGLAGKNSEETPGYIKPTIKSGRISTSNGRVSFGSPKSTQSKSFSFEHRFEANLSDKRSIDRDNMHSPAKGHSSLLCSPPLSTEDHNRNTTHDLEASEYWISQIRMAEFAGKHFVSFEFFRLALECKAKPFERLFDELRDYASRHGYLLAETAWKDLFHSYWPSTYEIKCVGLDSPLVRAANHHCGEDAKSITLECSCISCSDSQDAGFEEDEYKDLIDSDESSKSYALETSLMVNDNFSHANEKNDGYQLLPDDIVKEKTGKNDTSEFQKLALQKIALPTQPDTAMVNNERSTSTIAHQNISSNKSKRGVSSEISLLSVIPWSVCAIQYLLVIFWMCLLLTVMYLLLDVTATL
ncbi:unnamed protein product [Victoria cruziana]